jgi:putative tryptophan/tyrosine transport system substrate-binding protein
LTVKLEITHRAFLIAAGLLLFASFAEAQPAAGKIQQIGFVTTSGSPDKPSPFVDGIKSRLRDLGLVEGRNYTVVVEYGEGKLDRMAGLVEKLIRQRVDVLVLTNNVAIAHAKAATNTIPVVMLTTLDPIAAGYVDSLSRPGGNLTGVSLLTRDLSVKRVEIMKELIPKLSRLAILWDPEGPGPIVAFRQYEAAAKEFGLRIQSLELRGPNPNVESAFRAAKEGRAQAMIVVTNPTVNQEQSRIVDLASAAKVPAMFEVSDFVTAGGLLSYGASVPDARRVLATYVDRILKGVRPGDLPIQQASSFELAINLKTARAISLTIPQAVLLRAARVVE